LECGGNASALAALRVEIAQAGAPVVPIGTSDKPLDYRITFADTLEI